MIRKQVSKYRRTLYDLWAGISIYFIIFEIIGIFFVRNRPHYILGILLGCGAAAILARHMYISLEEALNMGKNYAAAHIRKSSMVRMLVMLAVLFAGISLPILSFPAVLMGLMSLKIAALIQPYTNSFITEKLYEKKGW